MSYRVIAAEAPSANLGSILWDTGIIEDYENALIEAAKYIYGESLCFGGNPDSSIEFLADYFSIDAGNVSDMQENETYQEWILRAIGINLEKQPPDPGIGQEVFLKNIDDNNIIHVWEGCTIFDPLRGLITRFLPKFEENL